MKTPENKEASELYQSDLLLIECDNEPLATIKNDGTIIYGKNYTPDKAAKLFWEALASSGHNPCTSCSFRKDQNENIEK